METPVVRLEFNSDGYCSRYRSAASHLPTASMALSHRNVGSCKFLVETPVARPEFNSDGCCFHYRSAASRFSTPFSYLPRMEVFKGATVLLKDMIEYVHDPKKHLSFRPWRANEACEAPAILRSGSESTTARSFLRHPWTGSPLKTPKSRNVQDGICDAEEYDTI